MKTVHLDTCKAQIEERLGWGPSEGWSSQDFEELSVRIQDTTGQVISATTLKRIWGRVAYDNKPSRHSLDTLSLFLGYNSWRTFTSEQPTQSVDLEDASDHTVDVVPTKSKYRGASVLILSVGMLLLGASTILWLGSRSTAVEPSEAAFTSRTVSMDLPNTVIFEYDVSGIQADSFFIQQSWDRNLRQKVSPSNSVHSSTYFYPGYYSAKLIANNDILLEHPVHVKTPDWKVLVEEGPTPVYLPEEAMMNDGTLAISKEWVDDAGYMLDSGNYVLGYYLVQDFGPLQSSNFSMEAVISHIKSEPIRPCQGGRVTIRGEDGMIQVPFDIPGCTGLMHVTAGDTYLTGESNDLSSLGADYSSWQLVQLRIENKEVTIQIGTNQPFSFNYTYEMGKVVGIWFQFVGRGMVDEIRLSDEHGRILYEELF